jgi:hypothetical protein
MDGRTAHSARTEAAARRQVDVDQVEIRDKVCDIGCPRDRGDARRWSTEFRQLRGITGAIDAAFVFVANGYAKVRRIRCALTRAQSPLRLGKARVYLAGHEHIEHSVPARTHSRGKVSQTRGFLLRATTKSRDKVCRNCCDFISTGIKERQSHREVLGREESLKPTRHAHCVKRRSSLRGL